METWSRKTVRIANLELICCNDSYCTNIYKIANSELNFEMLVRYLVR